MSLLSQKQVPESNKILLWVAFGEKQKKLKKNLLILYNKTMKKQQ